MPFQRFTRARRRFSATPRRRFSSPKGTTPGRLQICNFDIDFNSLIVPTQGQAELPPELFPSFSVQAITPWENLSESGYDARLLIKGIIFTYECYQLGFDEGTGEEPGIPTGGRAFARHALAWFVDAEEKSGAPESFVEYPVWPFSTLAPIANPGDDETNDAYMMPTRVVKRHAATTKCANITTVQQEAQIDAAGYTHFKWSATIRRRLTIDSRQALYFHHSTVNPLAGIDLTFYNRLHGCFYYKLLR